MDKKVDLPMSIAEFYKGKSILLTGFTGVLGKLLVEKLLYSCPQLAAIYVLIRANKQQTAQQRAQQVFTSKVFTRVREKYPGLLESKLIWLDGDVSEERLGLSQENELLLKSEVSIILHSAASVRFNQTLDFAVRVNTLGTKRVVDLALTMPHLVCLAYISTAYTNCENLFIKEEIYPPKADWRKTVEICEKMDKNTLEVLAAKYMGETPNAYLFSKSLAEQVINDYRDQLPVLIVRPSIVVSASKEPLVGWAENLYGWIGPFLGVSFGLIRCMAHKPNLKANNIPSDIVVNAVIAATWETSLARNVEAKNNSVTVYNMCTSHSLVCRIEDVLMISETGLKPYFKKIGLPSNTYVVCTSELSLRINVLFRHLLSAYMIDLLLILSKKQPIMVKIRRKIFITSLLSLYFLFRTFRFETTNFDNLMDHMTLDDKNTFGWNIEMFDRLSDAVIKFNNLKYTVLKPFYDNIVTNTRALRMLYIVDKFAVYLTYSLVGFFIYYFNIPSLLLSTAIRLISLP